MVGPGIARSRFGGVMFIFPPRMIPDIWTSLRLPRTETLEEKLIAAAVRLSAERNVAVVSPCPLKQSWRRLARDGRKRLIHLPLSKFSGQMIDRLRTFHVLNGREIRSFASKYIVDE
jgi:hypothetical protein